MLFLLAAANASAAFVAPSFIRQWDAGPVPSTGAKGAAIATDPFGDVYVLKTVGGGNSRVFKYQHDGTPVPGWTNQITGAGAIATDAQGHVYVGTGQYLYEFTSTGGQLGKFSPTRFYGDALAVDSSGNVYGNGADAGGQKAVNEYAPAGPNFNLTRSAPYPGTPSSGFLPYGFLGLTVDPAGNVYGSGVSTTRRFLARYPAPLGEPVGYLDNCDANADPPLCFGGFGITYADADVSSTQGSQPTIFSAGGYLRKVSGFYDIGVFSTTPTGSNPFLGSFQEQPVPGGYFTNVAAVAGSACHAAVYALVNVFGGPNNTISGWAIQEFDTHAAPTACASGFTAGVSGFKKKYVLPRPGGTGPCTPCAPILPSGAFAQSAASARDGAVISKKKKHKKRGSGVTLTYTSSAAADTTFLFKRIGRHGKKRNLGGFIYAAHAGQNQLLFSGALRNRAVLKPGAYRVAVSAGTNTTRFKLLVPRKR